MTNPDATIIRKTDSSAADASQISALLSRLPQARVVCVGDLMLDRYIEGRVNRLSPEAPIPVLEVQREQAMLGGVGNVLRNLVALGVTAELVAAIGVDRAGRELAALLAQEPHLTPRLVSIPGRQTSVKTRFLAGNQQLLRADRETTDAIADADSRSLLADAAAALKQVPDAPLVLSDYGKGVIDDALAAALIDLARAADRPVVVDPKGRDYGKYRGATLLTPNRLELALATGMPTEKDDEVVAACRQLIAAHGIAAVLATRSERGMTLVEGDAVHHLPARAREVFDVSGAGDTVVAIVAASIAAGAPLALAAKLANLGAGVVVGKVGTAVAHPAEILSALHESEFMDADAKVVTRQTMAERAQTWRRRGWRVGFTNGCFDLLHPGHVSLLQQARSACDRLVVGLNSDASVKRLKGAERPIQSETSRAAVLASLASVDLVVIFGEDDPLKLIDALRPDVLVKGADYSLSQVVGADEVQSWGGKVVLADILSGHSTSDTIRRMAT
ncbi:MAG: D-glycero-beta-D-manno-heptose-7-phosphate kinase [Alphaproteobacteria bacterium]|nr:D-glycero-beta-D-manno-heptose-7-phosphate kinase [Alphaproteobacteria bacterium]